MWFIQKKRDNHWNDFSLFCEVVTQTHHRMAATLCDWHWQWIHRDCSSEFPISFAPALLQHSHWYQFKEDEVSKSVTVKVLSFKAIACLVKQSKWAKNTLNHRIHKQIHTDGRDCKHISIQIDQLWLHSIIHADIMVAKHAAVLQIKWLQKQSGVNRQVRKLGDCKQNQQIQRQEEATIQPEMWTLLDHCHPA